MSLQFVDAVTPIRTIYLGGLRCSTRAGAAAAGVERRARPCAQHTAAARSARPRGAQPALRAQAFAAAARSGGGVTSGGDDDQREGEALEHDAERVGRHRVAEDDDAAEDAGDVGRGRGGGDDGDRLAVLHAARGGVEGDDGGEQRDGEPGRDEHLADAAEPGQRLDGDVGHAEQHARRGAEHDAVVVVGGAEARAGDQERADRQHAGLEGDHARHRVGRVRRRGGRQRDDEQQQAARGHRDAEPLAQADLEAEHPLGEHGEDHDAGGEHGLHDRQRREGQRGDVEDPGAERDGHAEREPLERTARGRPQRMADVDGGCLVRTPVLVEEAELCRDRAGEREQDAEIERHVDACRQVSVASSRR